MNLWGSVVIPIIQPKQDKRRPPPPPECSFCLENYSELVCQFYEPKKTEFLKGTNERNGKVVVCECCDHSDEEEKDGEDADASDGGKNGVDKVREEVAEEESSSRDEMIASNRRRQSNELNEISNNLNRNGEVEEEVETDSSNGPAEKVPKIQSNGTDQKENGTTTKAVVQAGWYGKGYRKYRQQRRRKS